LRTYIHEYSSLFKMAQSVPELMSMLQSSLESAIIPDTLDITPPANGLSLLDLKNELFVSYLTNLAFLILVRIRHHRSTSNGIASKGLIKQVTEKLVELRLYLEKGVKPLEGKLKYQIDKVVKAAEDATRAEAPVTNGAAKDKKAKKQKHRADESEDSERSSASESEEEDDDASASASASEIDELAYRPNPAALARPTASSNDRKGKDEPSDGIYRPPRITATAMPTTRGKEEKPERRLNKSATLDEFIATELSTAPIAEPSIGSTIVSGGRRLKTQRERDDDAERTRYEETHLTRLPKESKKERAKKGGRDRGGFGGEDFRNLEAGLDRIGGLVKRKEGGKMEGSRKRSAESAGLGGGDVGMAFDKRKKSIMRRMR
jgi:U3 small nucleolar ribonucleoprotein protein LCP5